MNDALQTDEYSISLSREIAVCKGIIDQQRRALSRFEQLYKIPTEKMLHDKNLQAGITDRDLSQWRNGHETLFIWQQRLREYEEAYVALR